MNSVKLTNTKEIPQIPDKLTPNSQFPFDTIHLDILSLNKEKYLTIIDSFTKFASCKHLKSTTSVDIAANLIEYFAQYQVPNKITTDSGVEFNNEIINNLLKGYKIKLHITSVGNPQSNGLIEQFHSSVIEHFRLIEQ